MKCDLCKNEFNPRSSPFLIIGGLWVCCSDRYTPEEIADQLGMTAQEVCADLGIEEAS